MKRLKIAITMGDPAGIGPEIIAKMYLNYDLYKVADVFVIGDLFPMLSAQRRISSKLSIRPMSSFSKLSRVKNTINLMDMKALALKDFSIGEATATQGKASFEYIKTAIKLAVDGDIDAIVTAPITKYALHMAGVKYPGHTEMLSSFTKTKKYAMLLMSDKLKVVLATIHTGIKNVAGKLTPKGIFDLLVLTDKALRKDFGISKPSIAVCGLNPHAGEAGAFGNEEIKIIKPAIAKAVKAGINAQGPYSGDTIFQKVIHSKSHDAVVAMYHDQGLIPLKLLSFETGVNVTLGLPIVRTSPDHGTAYDIAGTAKASEKSIYAAFKTAIEIVKNRKRKIE